MIPRIVAGVLLLLVMFSPRGFAQAPPLAPRPVLASDMLTGTVRSTAGAAMEGVSVSARAPGSNMSFGVFTDAQGRYVFPPLGGGTYRILAQAVGFEAGRAELVVAPGRKAQHDFTLKTIEDFSMQLTGAEWMAALPESTPADRRLKQIFQNTCTGCHGAAHALQNRFDEAGWRAVIGRMENIGDTGGMRPDPWPLMGHFKEEMVAYLVRMRGPGPSPMKFQALPRPKGEAARAFITEYEIPNSRSGELPIGNGNDWSLGHPADWDQRELHDAVVDFHGNAWVTSSGERSYVKVDVKTGEVADIKVNGPTGRLMTSHAVAVGLDGIVWFHLSNSIARIEPRTGAREIFTPAGGGVNGFLNVDGKNNVWGPVEYDGVLRLDAKTKKFSQYNSVPTGSGKYDATGDSEGNGWWNLMSHDIVNVVDVKTGKTTSIKVPPRPEREEMLKFYKPEDIAFYEKAYKELQDSPDVISLFGRKTYTTALQAPFPWSQSPRRIGADMLGDMVWSANWWGQSMSGINIRTHQLTLVGTPIPNSSIYDTDVDRDHMPWATLRDADSLGRYNPQTKEWTVFSLPSRGCQAHHVSADLATGDVWQTCLRQNKITRLQIRTEAELRAVGAR